MAGGPQTFIIVSEEDAEAVVGFVTLNDGVHILPGERLTLTFKDDKLDQLVLRPAMPGIVPPSQSPGTPLPFGPSGSLIPSFMRKWFKQK